jgi:hypothetical protein
MMDQFESSGDRLPRTLFVTAATGTTVAGFVLAEHLRRIMGEPPVRIVGVQIYPGRIRESTGFLARWAALTAHGNVPARFEVDILSGTLSGGF